MQLPQEAAHGRQRRGKRHQAFFDQMSGDIGAAAATVYQCRDESINLLFERLFR